jgi:hypothetical protein
MKSDLLFLIPSLHHFLSLHNRSASPLKLPNAKSHNIEK